MNNCRTNESRAGLTLMELLVVIAIITILLGLIVPSLFTAEERANRTKCLSNVRQVANAGVMQFEELGDTLPFRPSFNQYGLACEALLPYARNMGEIFDCPAKPAVTNMLLLIPKLGVYTDYEINGYLSSQPATMHRRQSMITDYSLAAFDYDYPYQWWGDVMRAHNGGANVGYLDGHAAWLPDEEMGTIDVSGEDGSEFYTKGHDFWRL